MNLGPGELLIILVIVLIVFGAGKLPQVFSSLGKGVKEFRDASEGREDSANTNVTTTATSTTVAPAVPPPATEVAPTAQTAARQDDSTKTA